MIAGARSTYSDLPVYLKALLSSLVQIKVKILDNQARTTHNYTERMFFLSKEML